MTQFTDVAELVVHTPPPRSDARPGTEQFCYIELKASPTWA